LHAQDACGTPLASAPLRPVSSSSPPGPLVHLIPIVPGHAALRLSLALAATLLAAVPLRAQGGAVLRGYVVDEASGGAVPAARVVVDDRAGAEADGGGRFEIGGLRPGQHRVHVERLGYEPADVELLLGDSIDLTVALQAEPQALPAVAVTAPGPAARLPEWMRAFEIRRAHNAGGGRFITRVDMAALGRTTLVGVLRRMPGTRIIHDRAAMGDYLATGGSPGPHAMLHPPSPCYAQVLVNGVPLYTPGRGDPPDLNDFDMGDLEAIEYYSQPTSTPSEFRTMDVGCGTLVLWMRASPAERPR
jgi:hypothetical protein